MLMTGGGKAARIHYLQGASACSATATTSFAP